MASVLIPDGMLSREVPFCRVHSKEAKDKLEKIFLQNRISYFIDWQERSLLSKLFGSKEKSAITFKINEDDVARATELVKDIEGVKIRK